LMLMMLHSHVSVSQQPQAPSAEVPPRLHAGWRHARKCCFKRAMLPCNAAATSDLRPCMCCIVWPREAPRYAAVGQAALIKEVCGLCRVHAPDGVCPQRSERRRFAKTCGKRPSLQRQELRLHAPCKQNKKSDACNAWHHVRGPHHYAW
jgi:hypothetical protein